MKVVLVTTVSALALISTGAMAADLQPRYSAPARIVLAPTWAGFYVGAVGSYGTGSASGSVLNNGVPNANGNPPSTSLPLSGGFGGIEAGYNWQFGRLVAGIETDYSFGSMSGTGFAVADPNNGAWGYYGKSLTTTLNNYGTTRARVGYAVGNWLPFISGGVAYTNVNNAEGQTCQSCGATPVPWGGGTFGGDHVGYAVGAGTEYALGSGWSVKAEYLHLGFGSQSGTYNGTGSNFSQPNSDGLAGNLSVDVVRAGVNYHF